MQEKLFGYLLPSGEYPGSAGKADVFNAVSERPAGNDSVTVSLKGRF